EVEIARQTNLRGTGGAQSPIAGGRHSIADVADVAGHDLEGDLSRFVEVIRYLPHLQGMKSHCREVVQYEGEQSEECHRHQRIDQCPSFPASQSLSHGGLHIKPSRVSCRGPDSCHRKVTLKRARPAGSASGWTCHSDSNPSRGGGIARSPLRSRSTVLIACSAACR